MKPFAAVWNVLLSSESTNPCLDAVNNSCLNVGTDGRDCGRHLAKILLECVCVCVLVCLFVCVFVFVCVLCGQTQDTLHT